MGKIATAFIWALALSLLTGLVLSPVMVWFDLPWWTAVFVTTGLTIVQAWVQSRHLLHKALGHKETPGLIVGNRAIPVSAGGLAMSFESMLPGRRKNTVDVEDQLTVMTATGLVIAPGRVEEFIRLACTREYRGKSGLSRHYWTRDYRPPWDRSEYEAMIYVLQAGGHIVGRQAGRSGKLVGDYRAIINDLKRSG